MLYNTKLAAVAMSLLASQQVVAKPIESRGSMWEYNHWPNAEIPYILTGLPHDLSENIRGAMRMWEAQTCVRFVPYTNQPAWAEFRKWDQGCFSQQMGAPSSGATIVNLDSPNFWDRLTFSKVCNTPGTAGHEIGHLIGLAHEQQRPDRDQYVRVLTNRIDPNFLDQFDILPWIDTSLPFDYNSIMMYSNTAFSKNNKPTIESLTNQEINPYDTATQGDYAAVNKAYNCPAWLTNPIPECRKGAIPANTDFSSYDFIIDDTTFNQAKAGGYTHIAVHQHCNSNAPNMDTDNWGFTPVAGAGPNARYKVTTDRCKKTHDRHAAKYEIALCRGDWTEACDMMCGYRSVCPTAADGTDQESKAVDLVDDAAWVCHAL
ncbi:metalloendopeptidase [Coleophoma cylindrospora]|uniref:Metalloendopeptidase n=1 Tax=Coleophoma cylindrospora TaxID=1849047 RepID=A0A3D8QXL1_9HELO|nr:metalloendopeptidase [Coleophoma cylindrospora]